MDEINKTLPIPDYTEAMDQVPPGWYKGHTKSLKPYTAKTGTQCAQVLLSVTEGLYTGRTIPVILPMAGKAAGFFRKFVRAIIPEYIDGPVSATDIVGKSVLVKVEKSTYINGARSYLRVTVFPADHDISQEQPVEGV